MHNKKVLFVACFILFGLSGVFTLATSHGANVTISFPAAEGTVNGCASVINDASSSTHQAVKFGTCTPSSGGLDDTGNTIPDTNYAIPAGAIFMATTGNDTNPGTQAAPLKTIAKAISSVPNGGTIVIRGGTDANPTIYRDWYKSWNGTLGTDTFGVVSKSVTIQAYPHEKAWFDGTDTIPTTSWTKNAASTQWSMAWDTPSFCGTLSTAKTSNYYGVTLDSQRKGATGKDGRPEGTRNGPCAHKDASKDPSNPLALDPQMVFIDGAYMHQVETLGEVSANNFFYDWANKRIYIGSNPAGRTIELAARPMFAQFNGSGSKVLGLGFKRYASHVYFNNPGAIYAGAGNQKYENLVFKDMAGYALYLGTSQTGNVVNHSAFVDNGGNGINGANGNVQIMNSLFSKNNTELFWTGCYYSCNAANIKLHNMNGFAVKNNIIKDGQGGALGVWCDITCANGVYANNVVANNGNAGIFHEVSDSAIIASNVVYGNRGAGIRVASANVKIYNNTVVNNSPAGTSESYQGNVWIYDDPRTPDNPDTAATGAGMVGPDTRGLQYANNIVTGAIPINHYSGSSTTSTNTQPTNFFDILDYNAYWRSAGGAQVLTAWSDATAKVNFTSASAFSSTHAPWESHSIDIVGGGDPFFVNTASGDYRLRLNNQASTGRTIPNDVLSVLGLSSGSNLPKGAINWPGKP